MRIETGPLSESEQAGFRQAGYVELRGGPTPQSALKGGPYRVIDVGRDWIEIADEPRTIRALGFVVRSD